MKNKFLKGFLLLVILISTSILLPLLSTNNYKVKINKSVNIDILKSENKPYILLYFGYVGCVNSCMPRLKEIANIYKKVNNENFEFYFINLLKDSNSKEAKLFAKSFHKKFNGIYLNEKDLNKLTKEFKLFYSKSFLNEYEINHTSFLYLIEREKNIYKLKNIYIAKPFSNKIIDDLKNLI